MARAKKPRDENGDIIPDGKTIRDQFIEPYHITMDEFGYSIQETIRPDNSDKVYVKPVGHYTSFVNCLEKLARIKLNEEKCYTSIKEYIGDYDKIKNEIKTLITI